MSTIFLFPGIVNINVASDHNKWHDEQYWKKKLTWNCVITWTNISDKEIDVRFLSSLRPAMIPNFCFIWRNWLFMYQIFIWKTCMVEMKNPLDLYISLILNWNGMNFNDSLQKLRSCLGGVCLPLNEYNWKFNHEIGFCMQMHFIWWLNNTYSKSLVVLCAQNRFSSEKLLSMCCLCALCEATVFGAHQSGVYASIPISPNVDVQWKRLQFDSQRVYTTIQNLVLSD